MIDRSRLSNAFEFVAMAGARARQLLNGCVPRVSGPRSAARIAQLEVLTGAVTKADQAAGASAPAAAGPADEQA